jgi:hypothetical protein
MTNCKIKQYEAKKGRTLVFCAPFGGWAGKKGTEGSLSI